MKEFIANIDDANIRIAQLETQLGREPSGFVECLDTANDRIDELEAEFAKSGVTAGQPAGQKNQPAGQTLTGIRRAIAANGGGVIPSYGATKEPTKGTGIARAIAAHSRQS